MGTIANITCRIQGRHSEVNDLGSPYFDFDVSQLDQYTSGTSQDQADIMFADTRTIAASSSESLDLNGSSLQNVMGVNLALAKVKVLLVRAAPGNTNDVVVGNTGAGGFVGPFGANTHSIALKPGEQFLITNGAGWACTASSLDLLKIANGGGTTSVTYDIVIIGTSA